MVARTTKTKKNEDSRLIVGCVHGCKHDFIERLLTLGFRVNLRQLNALVVLALRLPYAIFLLEFLRLKTIVVRLGIPVFLQLFSIVPLL